MMEEKKRKMELQIQTNGDRKENEKECSNGYVL